MEVWKNELYHHGIKGQKWGIRRYQNPDGSLTKAGLSRYKKQHSGDDPHINDWGTSIVKIHNSKEVQNAIEKVARNKSNKFDTFDDAAKLLEPLIKKEIKTVLADVYDEPIERIVYRKNKKGNDAAYLEKTTRGKKMVDDMLLLAVERAWDMDFD